MFLRLPIWKLDTFLNSWKICSCACLSISHFRWEIPRSFLNFYLFSCAFNQHPYFAFRTYYWSNDCFINLNLPNITKHWNKFDKQYKSYTTTKHLQELFKKEERNPNYISCKIKIVMLLIQLSYTTNTNCINLRFSITTVIFVMSKLVHMFTYAYLIIFNNCGSK